MSCLVKAVVCRPCVSIYLGLSLRSVLLKNTPPFSLDIWDSHLASLDAFLMWYYETLSEAIYSLSPPFVCNTSRQEEGVRVCPDELCPFYLTPFALVIIYKAWKCNQNTNCAYEALFPSLSLYRSPLVVYWFSPSPAAGCKLSKVSVDACVKEQSEKFRGQLRSFR